MSKPASSSAKILRVGVIHDGKIIEERHIRHRVHGHHRAGRKNTFVIPASELPATFPVFEHRNGQYTLLFTDRMNGRVRTGAVTSTSPACKSRGLVQKRGSV